MESILYQSKIDFNNEILSNIYVVYLLNVYLNTIFKSNKIKLKLLIHGFFEVKQNNAYKPIIDKISLILIKMNQVLRKLNKIFLYVINIVK
jgi:hypothetical protein